MNQNSVKAMRQSNIELLRILAAFGVIVQHYNNPNIGGAIRAVIPRSPNAMILAFLHVGMICAVNLFILISGYFMRDTKKRDLLKPVKLLSMLIVFELLFYIIQVPLQGIPFSFSNLMQYYLPNYWFIIVYIALYLISPFINMIWNNLSKRNRKILLGLSLGLFSVYPIITEMIGVLLGTDLRGTSTVGLDGSESGYTIVNFVLMYLIGCALRDHDDDPEHKDMKPVSVVLLLFLNISVLMVWMIIEKSRIITDPTILSIPYRYQNPLVISEAVLYFLLFKQIKIKNSKVINSLASAAFPSYLIHINLFRYCGIEQAVNNPPAKLLAHVLGCAAGIYLISWAVYMLYNLITGPLFRFISRKWQKKRIYVVELPDINRPQPVES